MPLIELDSAKLSNINAFALSFSTKEMLSHNSHYFLEFECEQAGVDYELLLGEAVGVRIERKGADARPFHAYIVGATDAGQHQDKFVYKLELSTWLWFLMKNHNSRIFQDLNVLDIIERIFVRYGIASYRLDVHAVYPRREYCVQFAETDFAFVNRLLESEGITYYFEHDLNKHTLVITDREDFSDLEGVDSVLPFLPDSEENRAIREGIQRLNRSRHVSPNEIVLRDFDYLNPRNNLQTKVEESRSGLQNTPLEWYDYAAGYLDTQRGEHLARLRLEELQGTGHLLFGESNAIGLVAGKSFSLKLHPDPKRNRRFKLVHCNYTFVQDGPNSSSAGRQINCKFSALNDDVTFRPLRKTPRPQMPGIQSATVVGAPNSEVHTDQFARIRVHFHWDRYKTTEEDSSGWIRVVQAWAGKGWGVLAMPRVGQEVLVSYVDGDLDRPMVTGIVYNGDNPPPYKLPEQINYSGLVSRSLRNGNPQHGSQLTFDDRRGNERVMLHAERDIQTTVERNQATAVGMDKSTRVKGTVSDWFKDHFSSKDFNYGQTGANVSITGVNVSKTGVSTSFVGLSTSFTGLSTSFAGMTTSFTGVSTSFTGVGTSFSGVTNGFVGIANSINGVSNGFVGIRNSLTGASNALTGVSISVTGANTSITGVNISTTGSNTTATGVSSSTTGTSMSTTGVSMTVNGSSISTIGLSITSMGLKYAAIEGIDLKTVGMQSKN